MKVITPNFFKIGRNNKRALDGPIDLPRDGGELLKKVNETYQGLFKLWSNVYVPKLIYHPKWYRDDKDLHENDLVYFQKDPDNPLGSKWMIGIVEQVIRIRDNRVRRVIIKYQNHNEYLPRFTDRSIRKLVRIFDIEEYVLQDDLSELLQRLDTTRTQDEIDDDGVRVSWSQLMSSKLDSAYFTVIDPCFLSGAWLLPPVPAWDNLTPREEEPMLDDKIACNQDVPGDRNQVPVGTYVGDQATSSFPHGESVGTHATSSFPCEDSNGTHTNSFPFGNLVGTHAISSEFNSAKLLSCSMLKVLVDLALEMNETCFDENVPTSLVNHLAYVEDYGYSYEVLLDEEESCDDVFKVLELKNLIME